MRAAGLRPHTCDKGVSGAKDKRPALDQLVADARRRRFDVLVVWRLDRLGRNLRHLILLLDAGTPAGWLQLHILGAIAEFERARIQERVRAGPARVRAQGRRLGRRRVSVRPQVLEAVTGVPPREAAAALGVSTATLSRLRRASKTPAPAA